MPDMTEDSPARFKSALIVDDHPLFCDALAMTLQAVSSIADVRTAARLADAIEKVGETGKPDLVVLDLNLPDVDGLEGVVRLKTATKAPLIVVSSMTDNRVINSALRAGAQGFVPKHSQRSVFRSAVEAVENGGTFVPDGFVEIEDTDTPGVSPDDALSRMATLTNQQARILQLICEGKLNKQIAFDLSIAETTVKAHVTAIMRKLGVQSRTQAVLIAKETSFASVLQEPS